ncbi:importin [Niveomyces insectorum RCEF 264]|uniref:Importin n=1 Tax=Niveomyces insectorum RCEF 264 TaxID=1081102 RepID=A0A167VLT2_9HYPO|nr:importin [Niveomyces insectorum RCEF 264]
MSFAIEVPGEAVPLNLPDLCKALEAGNANDHHQRQSASKQLEQWQSHPHYFSSLQTVFLDRSLPYNVRFLAVILLKNGIDKFWRASARVKDSLRPDEKARIRARLLAGTIGEPDRALALHNALATAKVVRIDYPHDWPGALPELLVLLRRAKEDAEAHGGGPSGAADLDGVLLVLLRVIKELGTARLPRSQTALQRMAEELAYVLGDVYTTNVNRWLEALRTLPVGDGNNNNSKSDEAAAAAAAAVHAALAHSLTSLKVLRSLLLAGFAYPHRAKVVQEMWTLSQTHFQEFLGYTVPQQDSSGGGGGGDAAHLLAPAAFRDAIGKHLLTFTKLHLGMCELHPSSFSALPNAVGLVHAYWGLVARFADIYSQSDGLRQITPSGGGNGSEGAGSKSGKLEGPLLERLALKGLLLVKSCLQIVTQPLQTFKYRDAETQREQKEGVQLLKTDLFVSAFLLQMVDTIVTKLFVFRESDLAAWDEDPEEWWDAQENDAAAAWEWQVRPCAERVFLSLLIHYKELLAPPLLVYFQRAMQGDGGGSGGSGGDRGGGAVVGGPAGNHLDLLTREAVYTAMGNAAVAIQTTFDFNAFLTTTLVHDVQLQGTPLAKVLRRRVALLLGAWSFVELPEASLQLEYSLYAHLLNKADPTNDLVVRLTAAHQLKSAVDELHFRARLFAPYAPGVFAALLDLLQEVEHEDTKRALLETLRGCADNMGPIATQFGDAIVAALPAIWAAADADTAYLIKQSILALVSTLITVLGTASQQYHALFFPLIAEAMDPRNAAHQFLLEDAVELWSVLLHQTERPVPEGLLALLPAAVRVLDYDSHVVQLCLHILDGYIALAPEAVLSDQYRRSVLTGLAAVLEDKRWDHVKDAASCLQHLLLTAQLMAKSAGVAQVVRDMFEVGLLPRIFEQLHGAWTAHQATGPAAKAAVAAGASGGRGDKAGGGAASSKSSSPPISSTVEVVYLLILSRIALADPAVFVDLLTAVGDPAAVWPWLAEEWFARFDSMGNPADAKVACLALTRLCECPPPMQPLVLGMLQDYFAMWTAVVVDAQDGSAAHPDCFVWPSGAPPPDQYQTPLGAATGALSAQDPLHSETTYPFIAARLQDLIARAGGEAQFEAEWAVNVDSDVLAAFRLLTQPRPPENEAQ